MLTCIFDVLKILISFLGLLGLATWYLQLKVQNKIKVFEELSLTLFHFELWWYDLYSPEISKRTLSEKLTMATNLSDACLIAYTRLQELITLYQKLGFTQAKILVFFPVGWHNFLNDFNDIVVEINKVYLDFIVKPDANTLLRLNDIAKLESTDPLQIKFKQITERLYNNMRKSINSPIKIFISKYPSVKTKGDNRH